MQRQNAPQLIEIETVDTGWLNKYLLHYTLPDGRDYVYESVSRKKPQKLAQQLKALSDGSTASPDAVCIVPLLADGSVVLIREFRYPLNSWCISLPAGLIDPGETLDDAVIRELSEETGYRPCAHGNANPIRPLTQPGFSSTGMSEESVHVVFVDVEVQEQAHPEPNEFIETFTVKKKDLRSFLNENKTPIGTRCQLILELLAQTADS